MIDELGKMEPASEPFREAVERLLDMSVPLGARTAVEIGIAWGPSTHRIAGVPIFNWSRSTVAHVLHRSIAWSVGL